ncbi:3-hydroxyacyl-CoA dehydrogenase [Virgibacillus sp. AGTR]|uniref:3-hydroxyacyl-CoA dehydrogenase n=1 Tax=Virgibacillus salarius TaxID=447199 RepID=A0A941DTS0_9BACI|nr:MULTISPECIES: 3-hydroxyacyl-CoA dehydrogenase [Virgibacillus]NAZ09289.1 3-hydroxyacyl-CoA dehydrogenase [Agaribacter marinus]MBR7796580.1 3-hydroxyacyl-CoA dehydrogenase [Virgibacillus salarius]MCC2251696.1 3-hydroxyacyl-CoA dehydrogenase [Virgibacillus sp. AGTR]QRZ19434.1 3-hydroxyacyl-CoA dehydrogenase [Virgibacillus sp. AGTR]WBX80893.1 3-hydroxyacyl-CoA dehydrogenase [Virgibacillus salarius]
MTNQNITVAGAGVMGRGIAYVSALAGFHTILVDVSKDQLESAIKYVNTTAQKGIQKGKITEKQAKNVLANLETTSKLKEALVTTDLFIEAVPEKQHIKKMLMQDADAFAPKHTIFASNTSTISPTELASFTNRPEQVAVMHFFNPAIQMPLVEIVRGIQTNDQTVKVIQEVAKKLGKESVQVNEFPGFVTSRISALVGNEAFHMLQEGVATAEDIDKAIRLGLNYPMGPLELSDLVGLDARLNNLKYLHETLGEKYRPAPLLEQLVKAGRLGKKTMHGIYKYNE